MYEHKNMRIDFYQKFPGYDILQSSTAIRFEDDQTMSNVIDAMFENFKAGAASNDLEFSMELYAKSGNDLIWKNGEFVIDALKHLSQKIEIAK